MFLFVSFLGLLFPAHLIGKVLSPENSLSRFRSPAAELVEFPRFSRRTRVIFRCYLPFYQFGGSLPASGEIRILLGARGKRAKGRERGQDVAELSSVTIAHPFEETENYGDDAALLGRSTDRFTRGEELRPGERGVKFRVHVDSRLIE